MGLEREVADIVDQLGSIDSDVIAEGVEHLEKLLLGVCMDTNLEKAFLDVQTRHLQYSLARLLLPLLLHSTTSPSPSTLASSSTLPLSLQLQMYPLLRGVLLLHPESRRLATRRDLAQVVANITRFGAGGNIDANSTHLVCENLLLSVALSLGDSGTVNFNILVKEMQIFDGVVTLLDTGGLSSNFSNNGYSNKHSQDQVRVRCLEWLFFFIGKTSASELRRMARTRLEPAFLDRLVAEYAAENPFFLN